MSGSGSGSGRRGKDAAALRYGAGAARRLTRVSAHERACSGSNVGASGATWLAASLKELTSLTSLNLR